MTMFFRLKELREESNLNQTQVSRLLNCAQQTYSDYENHLIEMPIMQWVKLAEYYKTSVDYLLGLTDERDPYPKSVRNQF